MISSTERSSLTLIGSYIVNDVQVEPKPQSRFPPFYGLSGSAKWVTDTVLKIYRSCTTNK